MARAKNFKKSAKPSILDFLKGLTAWICKKNAHDTELITLLDKFPDVNINFVFNRLMSYNMTHPHIIWYFNKYLNNFYEFSALSSNKVVHRENKIKIIQAFKYIMDINGQSKRSNLFYLKSSELKDENRSKIKKLLREYFKTIHDKVYNEKELDHFYSLFEKGQILEEDIYKADEVLHNGKKTIKLNMSTTGFDSYQMPDVNKLNVISPKQYLDDRRKLKLPTKIVEYCESLKKVKQTREECLSCQLLKKPMIVLDTNMKDFGDVDVMFIGLNPSLQDSTYNKCFISDPSIVLREKLMKFNPTTKWVLTNMIMCHTPTEKEISKDWKNIMTSCTSHFLKDIISNFKPKIIVLVGRQTTETFGIKDKVTKASGAIYEDSNYKLIPLIHPSAVARSKDKNGAIFENSWENIFKEVETGVYNVPCGNDQTEMTCSLNVEENTQCSTFLNPENIITEVTDNLMLFNIVNLNNDKIIKIFIDEYGKKKYQYIDYEMPIFIKNNVNWSQNETITDQVDLTVNITGQNKYYVNKLLRDQLENIKAV